MRKPKTPPNSSDIFETLSGNSERFRLLFERVPDPLVGGKYLHWDEVVHRPIPEGLSREEWWFALKLHRQSFRREVPLEDKEGRAFTFIEPDPVPESLHEISLGAGGQIAMKDQIADTQTKDRYIISSLMEEAVTSSQLEGATTTRQVAREMLRAGRSPRDRSEQMILNNFRAMRRIAELKDSALNKELVIELHRLVTENTLDRAEDAGRIRRSDDLPVYVTDDEGQIFHVPPPAEQLAERMDAMCEFANGKTPNGFIHPAIRSIVLHFWLAYDHPFVDGNGRTARALFYWSMLRNGFWLFEFISISSILLKAPSKYSRAFLYTESDDNDLTYFIVFHLNVIRRALDELHRYLERKTMEINDLESKIKSVRILNHRQKALVGHALRHPYHRYTIQSHQMSHNVARQTASNDLLDLNERGLVEKYKVGRTWHFTPVEDLEQQLATIT